MRAPKEGLKFDQESLRESKEDPKRGVQDQTLI